MKIIPHASWAQVYDIVYEHSFGDFYNHLTDATIQVIADKTPARGKVVDFGAGTGRLSVPLAKMGFEVTAVEPCEEMLNQLNQKKLEGILLHTNRSLMQDYKGHGAFDIALCVFTVVLYLLDEESLSKSFMSAYDSLKPGGLLLIDIPSKFIFQGYSRKDHLIDRTVSVNEQHGDVFVYREDLKLRSSDGSESTYSDEFQIKYWSPEMVSMTLKKAGFIDVEVLSNQFPETGSQYWLMKKTEQGTG